MNFRTALAGLAMLFAWLPQGFGQSCQPDTSITTPGIFPINLPVACVGQPYSTPLTVVVPVDTVVALPPFGTFTLPIDSIVLNNILGLPAGFSYVCSPASCAVPGGGIGCVSVFGTPTVADTLDLRVALTVYILTPFGPIAQPDTIDGIFTLFVNPGFSTSITSSPANCGLADGTAKVSATGSSGSLTYAWSNGATTDSVSGLAAGVYTVVTTASNGCSTTDTVTIFTNGVNPVIQTDTAYWAGCASTGGGVIQVTASGGNGTYTYAWSNGATSASLSALAAGSYTLTVTDGLGCSDVQTILVTAPAELSLALAASTNILCFGDETGVINANVNGGLAPFVYAWSGGAVAVGASATNLAAGAYTLTVTDNAGCVKTLATTLTQPDSIVISVDFTGETAFGQKDGTAQATVTGGVGPFSYSWDNGAFGDSIGALQPAVYVLTVTDANGCTATAEVEIPAAALSLEDELGIVTFAVSPNPVRGQMHLSWSLSLGKDVSIRVRDLRGAVVMDLGRQAISGSLEVNLHLPAGLYLVELQTAQGSGYRKVLVE